MAVKMQDERRLQIRNKFFNIDPTFHFHRGVQAISNPASLRERLQAGIAELERVGIAHEKGRKQSLGMTAFCLSETDFRRMQVLSEQVFGIVEKAIDWVLANDDRLEKYGSDHRRMWPHLRKTRGTDNWQIISRYDVLMTPAGDFKIIELNTGDPAGFIMQHMQFDIMKEMIANIPGMSSTMGDFVSGAPNPREVVSELLRIEKNSGVEPGVIGLFNDEGGLSLELDHYQREFALMGRDAVIACASDLTWRDGRLYCDDLPISLTYNKMRVSTEESQRIGWKRGFEKRYEAFLTAHDKGAIVPVNNMCALTLPEDKSFMQVFADPAFRMTLPAHERILIDRHIVWTRKLEDTEMQRNGRTQNLLEFARANKDSLVIKPANESRGYKVVIGKNATKAEWEEAVNSWSGGEPMVVQEYVEPCSLPVPEVEGDEVVTSTFYHTLAMGMVNGKCMGTISRVSKNPVTNVSKEGYAQSTLVQKIG